MDAAWEAALVREDVATLERLLAEGQDPDQRDARNQTALMRAAHTGNLPIVDLLLRNSADPNLRAKYCLTALMLAIIAGQSAVARRLAHSGSDLSLKGSGAPGFHNKTAHDLAAERNMVL